ncbi:glycosyl transferase family protein [Sphingomonas sp. MMS12-HWE2-04]|uniref:glycosyl transferase family protein n=1 Tax=Sphingomonas sp. MMS12-HWE2-04 TaxID=3234199 RepID=UPI00384CFCC1
MMRESTLFAAIWFLIAGIDDLIVDVIYAAQLLRRRVLHLFGAVLTDPADLATGQTLPLAIFIGAWDESPVIGSMLRTALDRFEYPDYRLYVGTYPNDPATIAAVAEVACEEPRIRLVIGDVPGPTTKADCLNGLWRALRRDEASEGRRHAAIILHDAEDLVHPQELTVFAHYLPRYAAVQLPVLPLPHPRSRFVSGHYLDEFAEAHGKQLLVRRAVGAALPLAGVGCAIRRDMLDSIAAARGGHPFDASSLTEDYELGLTIGATKAAMVLARVEDLRTGTLVAVRAYFPDTLHAAVRQKARWMTGIALAGWDRTGWAKATRLGDHWMRMRDRRATLAIPVLVLAYCALVLWGLSSALHLAGGGSVPEPSAGLRIVLLANLALLGWRTVVRAAFVGRAYGWREAGLSVPRVFVGNYIALLAARRALFLYVGLLAGGVVRWDKTAHEFPEQAA